MKYISAKQGKSCDAKLKDLTSREYDSQLHLFWHEKRSCRRDSVIRGLFLDIEGGTEYGKSKEDIGTNLYGIDSSDI